MELTEYRRQIDVIDRELVALLEKRMDVSEHIAAWKRQAGVPILDAAREEEKLAAIGALCRTETAEGITEVFRHILAASRAYQKTLTEEHDGQ